MICKGTHSDPVHFNRGSSYKHVWICIGCEKQIAGPELPADERAALIEFIKLVRSKEIKSVPAKDYKQGEKEMKLEIAVLAGAESKQFLVDLAKLVERMEKACGKKVAAAPAEDEDDEMPVKATKKAASIDEDEDDEMPKKKKAAAVEDDEDDEMPVAKKKKAAAVIEDDEEDAPAPKKKAKKGPSEDDVKAACKARVQAEGGGKAGLQVVLGILKKKFKTQSVSDLDESQYQAAIDALEA